jgi:hypothetical protein
MWPSSGGALQRIHAPKILQKLREPTHRYKILNFENNIWFKININVILI